RLQDLRIDERRDLRRDVVRELLRLERGPWLGDRGAEPSDELEDGLGAFLREHHRVDDVGLGGFGRATPRPDDGVFAARDDHVDVRGGVLLERRISDEFAVYATDADTDEWPAPRNVRNVQRSARTGQRKDVGWIDLVARKNGRDDLRVPLVSV